MPKVVPMDIFFSYAFMVDEEQQKKNQPFYRLQRNSQSGLWSNCESHETLLKDRLLQNIYLLNKYFVTAILGIMQQILV